MCAALPGLPNCRGASTPGGAAAGGARGASDSVSEGGGRALHLTQHGSDTSGLASPAAAAGDAHGGGARHAKRHHQHGGHRVVSLNPSEMFTHLPQHKQVRAHARWLLFALGMRIVRFHGAPCLLGALGVPAAAGLGPVACSCRPACVRQVTMESVLGQRDVRGVPPEVLQLGLKYADGTVTGATARSLALLNVLEQVRRRRRANRGVARRGPPHALPAQPPLRLPAASRPGRPWLARLMHRAPLRASCVTPHCALLLRAGDSRVQHAAQRAAQPRPDAAPQRHH